MGLPILGRGLSGARDLLPQFGCGRYCAVMVPRMPAAAWPGTEQTNE
jgi:hypothetical protein